MPGIIKASVKPPGEIEAAEHLWGYRADGNPVCAALRDPVEHVAPGNGLWQRVELLVPTQGLARSWGMGALASGTVVQALRGRSYRFQSCHCRQFLHSGGRRWKKTGPNPTDRRRPGSKHHLVTDASENGVRVDLFPRKATANIIENKSTLTPFSRRHPASEPPRRLCRHPSSS